ncbi:hypothetical protein QUV83_16250 [Cellulomonas cellasea]|uniref:hypothetical protein n=1 Tax=Cellulomonas cellasea TaxID=43670 RepID=UPI0025A36126|nr:hypothetical protein [Cellulomonas cellasea]MDM8086327.1 hypothetical protein [Cellulomonas cellasea]
MNIGEKLDEIERVTNAATEGPWVPSHDVEVNTRPDWTYDVNAYGGDVVVSSGYHADTVFIADARTTVPMLSDALRAVLAVLPNSWEGDPYLIEDGLVDWSNLDDVVSTAVTQGQGHLAAQIRDAIAKTLGGVA